jgi:hypothetical protein
MIFFFASTIDSPERVKLAARVIRWASLSMAVIYLALAAAILSGYLDFTLFYGAITYLAAEGPQGEVSFRGETGLFVYKGFVMLAVGAFFFFQSKTLKERFYLGILLLAIVATLTRGFMLAFFATLLLKWFLERKWLPSLLLALFGTAFMITAIPTLMKQAGDKTESDVIRIRTMEQVSDRTEPLAILIGHGFGQGVPERPTHMEISVVEIFYKQGVIGLLWWGGLFVCLCRQFQTASRTRKDALPSSFFLGSLVIFIVSLTNPYMNNPIGMSIVLISLVSLDVLARSESLLHKQQAA